MFLGHKTAAVVACFWPRVGVEQKSTRDRLFRQHVHQVTRITRMHPNVIGPRPADFAQKHGNTVDVGFCADDPDIGVRNRLMNQMLTTAKADLKPDVTATEQAVQIKQRAIGILIPTHSPRAKRGKIFVKIALLAVLELLALEAAIKVAPGRTALMFINRVGPGVPSRRRVGFVVIRHQMRFL